MRRLHTIEIFSYRALIKCYYKTRRIDIRRNVDTSKLHTSKCRICPIIGLIIIITIIINVLRRIYRIHVIYIQMT